MQPLFLILGKFTSLYYNLHQDCNNFLKDLPKKLGECSYKLGKSRSIIGKVTIKLGDACIDLKSRSRIVQNYGRFVGRFV